MLLYDKQSLLENCILNYHGYRNFYNHKHMIFIIPNLVLCLKDIKPLESGTFVSKPLSKHLQLGIDHLHQPLPKIIRF